MGPIPLRPEVSQACEVSCFGVEGEPSRICLLVNPAHDVLESPGCLKRHRLGFPKRALIPVERNDKWKLGLVVLNPECDAHLFFKLVAM